MIQKIGWQIELLKFQIYGWKLSWTDRGIGARNTGQKIFSIATARAKRSNSFPKLVSKFDQSSYAAHPCSKSYRVHTRSKERWPQQHAVTIHVLNCSSFTAFLNSRLGFCIFSLDRSFRFATSTGLGGSLITGNGLFVKSFGTPEFEFKKNL